MKRTKLFVIFGLLSLMIAGCSNANDSSLGGDTAGKSTSNKGTEITVSAAASLTDALTKVIHQYEKQSNTTVHVNFASSGKLEKQIEQGAPTDVFLSASKSKMKALLKRNLIDKNHKADLLKNKLVLIIPKGSNKEIQSFADLKKQTIQKVAVGIPQTVPAGRYAKETLQTLHLWQPLQKKIVQANDVRQVLRYVEDGNVDAGIVYKSDALISDKVKIIKIAGESTHTPITYPVAVIAGTNHPKAAISFYKYLQTKRVLKLFDHYGFSSIH
ncbi:molybdate transport system substrate-binding protein [Scopulibacillus darangshiensis]|uniref:Molybdate transport system substrate-binding protein n=1 Tax=Scopulibacillus darangshiensis TaxID=442528 RepID=A0A4R2P987_9BACL|nr:molybdate ABC transporter substrate-binding protein [Scopulibacillus darangshiensis]TCP31579.1 molybdate transport system substrate-binding protein [Scopulibacillus darangshiensis]